MNELYPLKFTPIFKEKIWGGNRLKANLDKPVGKLLNVGESWEISGVEGNLSVISGGFLEGNDILELVEIYMGDLVGDVVYEKFGIHFPLLIKFIDANDYLSLQVHPDDDLAMERHKSFGKTEMWYVLEASKDAELIVGFNQAMTKQKYLDTFEEGKIREVLNFEKVEKGDVFFIPAGRIHATGPGILFAEIQQTSDLTYRIFDWDRVDANGKSRELHTELAVDAIDYSFYKDYKTAYQNNLNERNQLVSCPYFTSNLLVIDRKVSLDYIQLDSFVVLMGVEGTVLIQYNPDKLPLELQKGETMLIPAVITEIQLIPKDKNAKVLEVFIDTNKLE
jgi:mannose-6-phosphate isomerase